jgi:hypothetical protein
MPKQRAKHQLMQVIHDTYESVMIRPAFGMKLYLQNEKERSKHPGLGGKFQDSLLYKIVKDKTTMGWLVFIPVRSGINVFITLSDKGVFPSVHTAKYNFDKTVKMRKSAISGCKNLMNAVIKNIIEE